MTFGRNFLPGPTGVHPDVMAAMMEPMFAHYGPRMRPFLDLIQPSLQEMLGTTRPVFAVTCSGTGLLEAAVRNGVRHRLLAIVSGFFGEYFARIAEASGKEVVRINVPLGTTLEADQLDALLDGPQVDAVSVVHSESSTGALAPLAELAAVIRRRPDVMFLVDGVSSAAGLPIEMDRTGIDFMVTGSQKAMALPPGLAFGAVSTRMEARARAQDDAGHYFSVTRWVKMAADRELFETPALPIFMALVAQVRRIQAAGGWPARWERHRQLAARFHAWTATLPGATLLAPAERRSPTVSVLKLAEGRDPAAIAAALAEQGFMIGRAIEPGHGPLLRIGHMGDVEPADLEQLLATLGPLLS